MACLACAWPSVEPVGERLALVAVQARAVAGETGLAGVSLRGGHVAPHLTARQREVLLLWCDGYSAKEIAERLCVSEATVKDHIAKIYAQLGVANQVRCAREAARLGLV